MIEEYDIETADDIQEELKDLPCGMIKSMTEAEMIEHPGYERYGRSESDNYRSSYGGFQIDVSQNRESAFEPKIVKKPQKDIFRYANQIIKKLAVYVIPGINADGYKEVISLQIRENESSKYWLGVLNGLKNRGVKDVTVICADRLSGIKEAITTAFSKTEYRRCIVHMVLNTLKHVAKKDIKVFAKDLKTIYLSADEKSGYENMQAVRDIRDSKYPNAMKRWEDDQNVISPIFKFSEKVRRIIYTANAIENLNSTYKKLNCQRSVFPPEHYSIAEIPLFIDPAGKKKMDGASDKLGTSIWRILYNVSGSDARELLKNML